MTLAYPFLKTTQAWDGAALTRFKALGQEAVNYQVQNGANVADFDFGPTKAAGLRAEAWGVSYDPSRFDEDGRLLGAQARRLGADAVTMNAEMCAKGTRSSRGLKPIIDGIRGGGWTGPVNLNTLGSPSDPLKWDFEMDTESFLETGGGISVQAYINAHDEYSPANCIAYWTRFVPRDRLNLTLGLYDPRSENPSKTQLSGKQYADLLKAAGWGRGISIFRPETALPNDLDELWNLYLKDLRPEAPPSAAELAPQYLADIAAKARDWEALEPGDTPKTRLTLIRRIAESPEPQWKAARDKIMAALDEVGA